MKNIIQLTLFSFFFLSALANTHPTGHDKPQTIYEEQAKIMATNFVKQLIEKEELDKSWGSIKASKAVLERRDSRMNWIVSFDDPTQVEDKKSLFLYLINTGYYLTNNHTGE